MDFKYDILTVETEEEFIEKVNEGFFPENIKKENLDLNKLFELVTVKKDSNYFMMYCYAYFNCYGFGCEKNYEIAYQYGLKAIKEGSITAYYFIGNMYEFGYHVAKDYKKAYEYYMIAAEHNLRSALNKIGFFYLNGYGFEKDIDKAFMYYTKASDLGYISSTLDLGYIYDKYKKDYKNALKYYKLAADKGDKIAYHNLGILYGYGKGVVKNIELAISYFQKSIELNYVNAYIGLGRLYCSLNEFDKGLELLYIAEDKGKVEASLEIAKVFINDYYHKKDNLKAIEYFEKCLESKNSEAAYEIAFIYEELMNYEKAIEYYNKNIEFGSSDGHFRLGYIYSNLKYGVIDYEKSIYHYEKSIEANNYAAMNNLAVIYENGQGCQKDLKRSFELFQKATEGNEGIYFSNLGKYYLYGRHVAVDYNKAFSLFIKAVELNYLNAYTSLSYMYKNGYGVTKDLVKAKECLEKIGLTDDLKDKLDSIYYLLFDQYNFFDKSSLQTDKENKIKEIKKYIKELEKIEEKDFDLFYILGELYFHLASLGNNDDKNIKYKEEATKYFKQVFEMRESIINHPGIVAKYGKNFYNDNIFTDTLIYDLNPNNPLSVGKTAINTLNPILCKSWILRARLLFALNQELYGDTDILNKIFKACHIYNSKDYSYKEFTNSNSLYVYGVYLKNEGNDNYIKYITESANRFNNAALIELFKYNFEENKIKEAFHYLKLAAEPKFPCAVRNVPTKSHVLLKPGEKVTYYTEYDYANSKAKSQEALIILISNYNKNRTNINIDYGFIMNNLDEFIESVTEKGDINNAYPLFVNFNKQDQYLDKFKDIIDDPNIIVDVTKSKNLNKYLKNLLLNYLRNHNLEEIKSFYKSYSTYLFMINYDSQIVKMIKDRLFELEDPELCGIAICERIEKNKTQNLTNDLDLLKKYAKSNVEPLTNKIISSDEINIIKIGHELGYVECSRKYFDYLFLENKLEEAKEVYPNYQSNQILNLFMSDLKVSCNCSVQIINIINTLTNIDKIKTKEITKALSNLIVDKGFFNESNLIKKYMIKYNEYFKSPIILLGLGDYTSLKYLLIHYFNNYDLGIKICNAVINMDIEYQFKCPFIFNKAMYMYETNINKEMKKALELINDLNTPNKKWNNYKYNYAFYWLNNMNISEIYLKKLKK